MLQYLVYIYIATVFGTAVLCTGQELVDEDPDATEGSIYMWEQSIHGAAPLVHPTHATTVLQMQSRSQHRGGSTHVPALAGVP